MSMPIGSSLKKQAYHLTPENYREAVTIRDLGVAELEFEPQPGRRDWSRQQVCRQETFSLVVLEHCSSAGDVFGYTRQEEFLKINFWLSGKHSTILDGVGQLDHDRPEVLITTGSPEAVKVDVFNQDSQTALVALCVLPEFFTRLMGVPVSELPAPLLDLAQAAGRSHGFSQYPLTADLSAAARAVLAAPSALRCQPLYAQSKAVELMCLLVSRMTCEERGARMQRRTLARHEARLRDARDLLDRYYAQEITLERLSRKLGINRMILTTGFREMFGITVHDYLQKVRMQHAYDLLQSEDISSIRHVAEAVGYKHASSFSVAFHAYFGFSPRKLRRR